MSKPNVIAEWSRNQRERVRVALDSYAGHDLIDIRLLAELSSSTGTWVPTKKGISLRIGQLQQLISALQEAQRQAVASGLLTEGGDHDD